jgi:hypothetical protein
MSTYRDFLGLASGLLVSGLSLALVVQGAHVLAEPPKPNQAPPAKAEGKAKEKLPPRESYVDAAPRGKVLPLSEVLARKFQIESDAEAAQTLVLETAAGELFTLVKERRSRGFWNDAKLRGIEVELPGRLFKQTSVLQVIRVYTFQDGKKYEFDYWCDVCAIPMYEPKECECCQGPTRSRLRLVPPGQTEPLPEGQTKP